jgi:hypothetical protein
MACNRYCVTYIPENLPVDLYVRYSRCLDSVTVTELISGLSSVDNGDGTITSCLCTNDSGFYGEPVCVQNEMEIVCPEGIQWVLDNSELCDSEPTPCNDCLCKEIISERGDEVTYTYTDCYGVFQTSGVLPPMSTIYQCVCFDNQVITFSDPADVFVYASGACSDYQNCDTEVTQTPTQTPTQTSTSTPTLTSTATPTQTSTSTPTLTSTSTPTESISLTNTATPTNTPTETPTSTPTSTNTPTSTQTPTATPTSGCVNDLVTPKGVLISLNSGSDYTDCSVFTGITENTITGTTIFTSITGGTVNLTGIDATLMEIYVKIVCVGCCEQIFRINLDECCDYEIPVDSPTQTPTQTPTSTSTQTPTPTSTSTSTPTLTSTNTPTNTPTLTSTATPTNTPSSVCECSTYRINFIGQCGEAISWTDCDGISQSEQADYFGLSEPVFPSGYLMNLCACSTPIVNGCEATISLLFEGCEPTPTQTPTQTPTSQECIECFEYYNNTSSPYEGIDYTDCSGISYGNFTVEPGQSICVIQISGNYGFLIQTSKCGDFCGDSPQ